MSFWDNQSIEDKQKYIQLITNVITLCQPIMTDGEDGYLYYRTHEILFCKAFSAINLSRDDMSVDCSKQVSPCINMGMALKTFLCKSKTKSEKIAEFDKKLRAFNGKSDREKIEFISNLRNQRIKDTKKLLNLTDMEYHCVARKRKNIKIYELPMVEIDLNNIKMLTKRKNCNNIPFTDGINTYIFDISKSTLKMKFEFLESYLVDEFNIDNYLNIEQLLEIMDILKVKKIMMGNKSDNIIPSLLVVGNQELTEKLNNERNDENV